MADPESYTTPSTSRPGEAYTISWAHNHYVCSCPGYNFRGKCKHSEAVNRMCFIGEFDKGVPHESRN